MRPPQRHADAASGLGAVSPRLRGGLVVHRPQVPPSKFAERCLTKSALTLLLLLLAAIVVNAQGAAGGDEVIVEGRQAGDVFGVGRSVRVRGDVRGVIAFGGDVVVEGRVEGDAAAVGGSVIQLGGSHVGGDVIVFGGEYRNEGGGRGAAGKTLMYAGYEQELRAMARNPASHLTPEFSLAFVGWRLLAVLFWFVVSIALTAVSPGAVGRAAARLQVTFARVATHAATGRWLQRVLLPENRRSESVALLLGAAFWALALALPYVWPLLVFGLVVMSLGLALTARYRLNWRRA